MEQSGIVEALTEWAEQHRLVEEAGAQFELWLQSRDGTIGAFTRGEIQVAFHEQSLLFRTACSSGPPVVVTCLALTAYGGDCPLGTFKLLTGLDSERRGVEVEVGAEVALEELGGQVWRFYE